MRRPAVSVTDVTREAIKNPINDQVNPDHYDGVACLEAIERMLGRDGYIAFLRGQVLKYQWRLLRKGDPIINAEKSNWYGAKLAEVLSEDAG